MDLQPIEIARIPEPAADWPPQDATAERRHAVLHGATVVGEAARRSLSVRVGLWLDDAGHVRHARWRGADDATLRACAEAACRLLESGVDPRRLDATAIRDAVPSSGCHERSELVASALEAALALR